MSEPESSREHAEIEATKRLLWLQKIKEGKIPDVSLSPSSLPPTFRNRVFIGGNYDLSPVLRHIQSIVALNDADLRPIFLGDFEMPQDETVFHALRLLSECRRAIFEITIDSGHLIEIMEYVRKKDIQILLVYMASHFKKPYPYTATSMLQNLIRQNGNYEPIQGYRSIQELEAIVKGFLYATK
jgi:hypothetical protein